MNSYDLPIQPQYKTPTMSLENRLDDPVAMLSANKRELLGAKITMLLEQLEKRHEIGEQRQYGILQDECTCGTAMLVHQSRHDFEGVEKIELGELLALKKERRDETTSYFRDTGQLRRDLLDTLIEYKAVQHREKLINEVAQPRK
ncbi:hypothetical protein ACFL6C_09195 [Myxococcota bacterium]